MKNDNIWTYFVLSCMLSFMLSFDVIIFHGQQCYNFYVIIFPSTCWVLSFMLSFDVIIYCYHFPPFFFFLKTWRTPELQCFNWCVVVPFLPLSKHTLFKQSTVQYCIYNFIRQSGTWVWGLSVWAYFEPSCYVVVQQKVMLEVRRKSSYHLS